MKASLCFRCAPPARHFCRHPKQAARTWAACGLLVLAGCGGRASISGLRPISPPQHLRNILFDSNAELEFPEVASGQPVLEWAAYVPPRRATPNATQPERVSYDLWIWQSRFGRPPLLVYERTGLPTPKHQVECRLKPDNAYYWSVRARVESGGETRLTAWSCIRRAFNPLTAAAHRDDAAAVSYFRFVTPGSPHDPPPMGCASWMEFFEETLTR